MEYHLFQKITFREGNKDKKSGGDNKILGDNISGGTDNILGDKYFSGGADKILGDKYTFSGGADKILFLGQLWAIVF